MSNAIGSIAQGAAYAPSFLLMILDNVPPQANVTSVKEIATLQSIVLVNFFATIETWVNPWLLDVLGQLEAGPIIAMIRLHTAIVCLLLSSAMRAMTTALLQHIPLPNVVDIVLATQIVKLGCCVMMRRVRPLSQAALELAWRLTVPSKTIVTTPVF